MAHKFINVQQPFFIPLWRRIGVVSACLIWTVLEIYGQNEIWAMFAAAITLYCAHQFFISFNPDSEE
ncbi:MAG: hypothetical protein P8I83_08055 [Paracoccaceae bacterium]|jgi:hypothetical protein|nr:hypothetical protein [Paracoccaceae bacterium]